jgi:oligoendopeptidase F
MAESIPLRNEIKQEHRWDLTKLYADEELWETDYAWIEQQIGRYGSYRGRLAESAALFKQAVEFDLDMSRKLEKIYTYAHLRSDEDKADQSYLGMYQRVSNLHLRVSEAASYMTPEIQSMPQDIIDSYLKLDDLSIYRFYIERITRYRPYTLSTEIERILAMSGEVAAAPSQIFGQLDNADLRFGTIIDDKGREIELSHGNFISFLMNPSREVRKKAFFQYYEAYDAHKNTISAALEHSIKKDVFYDRVRGFASCRAGSLFSDNVPLEVYDNLISSVRSRLAPLFKYLNYRKKALGLDELHIYDVYVPLAGDVAFSMPFEEAVETSLKALAPLGGRYCSILREGLLSGWVDRYENRGKRSGAYSSGCYDSLPYILMNYRDDNINSLYTLIHEAGHSMHSYLSRENQPYVYGDYTIFVAEVASTFNEILLSKYLLEKYKSDKKMKAYILNREIDEIRGTLFRQCMFAEFELKTHAMAEMNEPLTLESMCAVYRELIGAYFGDTMVIDKPLELEFGRIPHFYSSFYVYKYATGISAAIALAGMVMDKGGHARDAYLGFLGLGGSKYPLDELAHAGVDMRSPEPVEKAIDYFDGLIDGLIAESRE